MGRIGALFDLTSVVLAVGVCVAAASHPGQREDWRLVPDGDGHLHFVDLTADVEPTRLEDSEVSFYYYSRKTVEPVKVHSDDAEPLKRSDFDPDRCSVFIVHGWKNDYASPVNVVLRNAVLRKIDCNVFSVDWSGPADSLYVVARAAVPEVGRVVARFISNVMPASIGSIRLMGHSLGAHVCGACGASLGGRIPTVVGMDPAAPLFSIEQPEDRLDPSDAAFVHVIHTCGGYLGFLEPIGHVDYYPNGGTYQDGCGADLTGSCSHSRSYLYYAESISGGNFSATKCDDYFDYMTGKCDGNPTSYMGTLDVDARARGNYYLLTAEDAPFALG